jgi:phosphatidylinositol glycan class M
VRKDNRHNFSVYFYHLYLQFEAPSATMTAFLAFAPQLVLMIALSVKFARDLPFCLFCQTLTFVAFNKVCTAQYFVWHLSLLPLVMPRSTMSMARGVGLAVLFFLGEVHWHHCTSRYTLSTVTPFVCLRNRFVLLHVWQLHWLYWGWRLEFLGDSVFLGVWAAGLVFFIANIVVLHQIIAHHISVSFVQWNSTWPHQKMGCRMYVGL